MAAAMAATMVDQHASEHPPADPDQSPPPEVDEDAGGRGHLYLYLGIALVIAAILLFFLV